jgi:agmatinase
MATPLINYPNFNKDNIFGLPFDENSSSLVILPVPWEVTLPHSIGTARGPEHVLKAARRVHVNLIDSCEGWKKGIFMRNIDKHLLMRSDYLQKEAELYINFLLDGGNLAENEFLQKTLKDVNAGCREMNDWVYDHTKDLLHKNKLVALLGGDHSTALGFLKALAEKENEFGILQIDAHCDLRNSYVGFIFSHGSVMKNALDQVPGIKKLVQIGVRDYIEEEMLFIKDQQKRIKTFFDKNIHEQLYEGRPWTKICEEIINELPQKVYISFDIDGLDPKLCPHTARPVPGGFEIEQLFYLFTKLSESGRRIIGFDLSEVSYGQDEWDSRVGANILFRLSNLVIYNNQ